MAYKDKKLYILNGFGRIRILDFSQDFPTDVVKHPYINRVIDNLYYRRMKLKLTTLGNILIIRRQGYFGGETIGFKVFKMEEEWKREDDVEWYLWKRVDSLKEEEALVWDLSVALPTRGVSGIKKDSVYFCDCSKLSILEAGRYEIPTDRMGCYEQCSHLFGVGDARWFLPCFDVGE